MAAAIACGAALTAPARAEDAPRDGASSRRVDLGLRSGYGVPLGRAVEGVAFDELFANMVPIWVEAGYRVSPSVVVGAFFQYAFVTPGERRELFCGGACSASDLRIGVQGQLHFRPGRRARPWAGLGAGYEIASVNAGRDLAFAFKGIELANVQAGADLELASGVAVGPFVSFSVGQYTLQEVTSDSIPSKIDLENGALHFWFLAGARAAFSL